MISYVFFFYYYYNNVANNKKIKTISQIEINVI